MPVIAPTVGRVVHFRDGVAQPEQAAMVTGVHSETEVDLIVFPRTGGSRHAPNTFLAQEGVEPPADRPYAHWMNYQLGQAAKTEQAEAAAKKK